MLGGDRGAVVVVARIVRLRCRSGWPGSGLTTSENASCRQPGRAVVGGLARPHPVARNGRVTLAAAGALARVIPHGEEGATRADRKVGLPLRTGSGIGVQFEWRAKGHAAVGGADVIDVAGIGAGAVLGIDQVNDAVEGGRLTPAHRAASKPPGSVNMQAK